MALGLVAGDGRLGFKKRWGMDEGWVVYGFEGGSAGSFSVFLVCGSELCGSELCGLDWEMNWEKWSDERVDRRNEGDRLEKWVGLDWEMSRSDWEMSGSNWEMEKGNSPCMERIGCVRENGLKRLAWGRWWSSVCVLGLGAQSLELLCSVCGSELGELCVHRVRVREQMENFWSENENWIHFLPQKPYFTVKLKIFSVWPNFPNLPNMLFSRKGFLNSVWSQNKWSLSNYYRPRLKLNSLTFSNRIEIQW